MSTQHLQATQIFHQVIAHEASLNDEREDGGEDMHPLHQQEELLDQSQ
jgi:hypothetical protein